MAAATEQLAGRWPGMDRYDTAQLARTREDLGFLLRFLEAAVLTGDDRILTDYLAWLEEVLASRGLPATVVPATLQAVQAALPPGARRAHDLLLELRA